MCGRYTNTVTDPKAVAQAFDLDNVPDNLTPRYNIAPTQPVMTIVNDDQGQNQLAWMRWGLIPSWAKQRSIGNRMINARAETLAEKPSFRSAYKYRRCLVVADGFYEWKKNDDKSKTPMYIRLKNSDLFGLAGLWERWTDPDTGELLTTCTIITGQPNELIKPLHHRMAVILPQDRHAIWLDRHLQITKELQPLLQPYPADEMMVYPVSTDVNNARNESPHLIEPVA